jgi:hypothetical protein
MAVDADAGTPGVQATRTVVGPDPFRVAVHVTQAPTSYTGYGFDPNGLYSDGGATHNVAGHGIPACNGDFEPYYCINGQPTTFTGWVTEFNAQCTYSGTYTLALDAAYSGLNGPGGSEIPTALVDAQVECTGLPPFDDIMSIRHSGGDPGEFGIGTVLNVPVGSAFNAEIWFDAITSPKQGYQWEIAYDPAVLTHTGNDEELQTSQFNLCAVAEAVTYAGYVIYGQGGGCLSPSPAGAQFTGHVTNVELACVAPTSGAVATPILLVAATLPDELYDPIFGTVLIPPVECQTSRRRSTRARAPSVA